MTVSLASSFRSPFLSTLSLGHVSSFLPATKLDLFTVKTKYEFLTPVSQVSMTILVTCCPSVNGYLISAQTLDTRVSIEKPEFSSEKWMWVCSKATQAPSLAIRSTVVTTITQQVARVIKDSSRSCLSYTLSCPQPQAWSPIIQRRHLHPHIPCHSASPQEMCQAPIESCSGPAQPAQSYKAFQSDLAFSWAWNIGLPFPWVYSYPLLLPLAPNARSSGIWASWGERDSLKEARYGS